MADPILYGPDYSTYVRTSRLALEEKGVPYRLELFDFLRDGMPAAQVRRVARECAPVLARSAQSYREALTAATPARAPAEPAAAVALF